MDCSIVLRVQSPYVPVPDADGIRIRCIRIRFGLGLL